MKLDRTQAVALRELFKVFPYMKALGPYEGVRPP